MNTLDPYALFGLNEHSANLAQARRAYYELALETHPDRAPAAERRAAADQFGALHAAWKWVEEQLRGVPDAGEVVARFEDQRRAWAEFAAEGAAAAGPLPLLRELVEGQRGDRPPEPRPPEAMTAPDWVADWPAMPRGGYAAAAPAPGSTAAAAAADPPPFPRRELVVHVAPAPAPDRATGGLPGPEFVEPSDYSVPDGVLPGCDYAIAMSEGPDPPPDERVGRTLAALATERAVVT